MTRKYRIGVSAKKVIHSARKKADKRKTSLTLLIKGETGFLLVAEAGFEPTTSGL